METYRLQRHGKLDLEFRGELIADATSDDGLKDRWQRFRLYRLESGRGYVLERLGESRVDGDRTMREVFDLPNAHQVRKALERKRDNGQRYLTQVALKLLDQAIERDDTFAADAVERI